MAQMQKYRELVAEKVLDKTLGNRLGRIVESTISKLEAKINEEGMTRKTAEDQWKRAALDSTVDYFDDAQVRQDFMRQALSQFCSGDVAKITNTTATVEFETDAFSTQYRSNYDRVRQEFLNEQRQKGTLSPVFMEDSERSSQVRSASEKSAEYESRVSEWASAHNTVNAPTPSFS
mmetsp:Transcript_3417/g.2917  ORF Transcript_3417/g.2917 Transcript_3417/m.2917 type:complete len:176 (-) Transcript_3417:324-851(-)